jgi:hypothetical protein
VTVDALVGERWWDSFGVGDRYRSESITVTETHVVNWAGLTGRLRSASASPMVR